MAKAQKSNIESAEEHPVQEEVMSESYDLSGSLDGAIATNVDEYEEIDESSPKRKEAEEGDEDYEGDGELNEKDTDDFLGNDTFKDPEEVDDF